MTGDALTVNLATSFVVGAVASSTLSITAERFGSKIAGALGGFPATIAASFFFLAMAGDSEAAVAATTVLPLEMGFFGVLVVSYLYLLDRGLGIALVGGLGAWGLLSSIPILLGVPPYWISLSVFIVSLVAAWTLVEFSMDVPSVRGGKVQLNLPQLLLRMVSGGSVVMLAVWLGSTNDPVIGGVMAAFPAVTTSTLVVSYQAGGAALSKGVAKSIMASAMVNATVLSAAVRYLYPVCGAVWGTVIAAGVVTVSGVGLYGFLRRWSR